MGKIVARQLLDTVFEHIAYNQGNKQRHGKIAVFLLKRKGYGCCKNHGDSGGNAVVDLLYEYPVLFLCGIEE
ncbi:hypothetical protein SDC9_171991 [bioreactor metagenome]|uniref:Uncharacterized protein n=1 Tax=bioreactor metagenome TaxID=1076179 RepID=A0A645GEZ4_9ZZZZ